MTLRLFVVRGLAPLSEIHLFVVCGEAVVAIGEKRLNDLTIERDDVWIYLALVTLYLVHLQLIPLLAE